MGFKSRVDIFSALFLACMLWSWRSRHKDLDIAHSVKQLSMTCPLPTIFDLHVVGVNGNQRCPIVQKIARNCKNGIPLRWNFSLLNEVFSKSISLTSANSVNHDIIQKWYGYQRYYTASNRYITIHSNRMCISITISGHIYCDAPLWTDTIPETVMEISFLLLHLEMYLLSAMECLW